MLPVHATPGTITELTGPPTSGRTTMAQALVAAASREGRLAVVVDAANAWNPEAAQAHGADLARILWVRCGGQLAKAMQAVDLVLRAGGFGLVWLDLDGVDARLLSRVPVAHWYRFRRALEHTETSLLIVARQSCAGASAQHKFVCERADVEWSGRLVETASYRMRPQKDYGAPPLVFTAKAG